MHDRRAAFTLVELLAVLFLLGLVTAIGTRSIAATTERASAAALLDRTLALEGMCRLWARQDGAVVLIRDAEAGHLIALRERDGTVLARENIADAAHVWFAGKGADSVRFDALGTSDDYAIHVKFGEASLQASVFGLTGVSHIEAKP